MCARAAEAGLRAGCVWGAGSHLTRQSALRGNLVLTDKSWLARLQGRPPPRPRTSSEHPACAHQAPHRLPAWPEPRRVSIQRVLLTQNWDHKKCSDGGGSGTRRADLGKAKGKICRADMPVPLWTRPSPGCLRKRRHPPHERRLLLHRTDPEPT